jgi:CheY-like chemotaxis protein
MKLVAEASNGQEALEKFRPHRPDVTVMDLQMPRLNGNEAIERPKWANPKLPDLVERRVGGSQQLRLLRSVPLIIVCEWSQFVHRVLYF